MARFARILRGLQRVFPSSDQSGKPGPSDLSETVSPVFDFPGRQGSIDRVRLYTANSGSVLTPAVAIGFLNNGQVIAAGVLGDLETVPPGAQEVYTEIIYGDLSHDSVTPRNIQLFVQTPGSPSVSTAIARWSDFATVLTDGQPSGFNPIFAEAVVQNQAALTALSVMHPHRPILLGPGWKLLVAGDTAAANWAITLQVIAIVHPIAEPPLLF